MAQAPMYCKPPFGSCAIYFDYSVLLSWEGLLFSGLCLFQGGFCWSNLPASPRDVQRPTFDTALHMQKWQNLEKVHKKDIVNFFSHNQSHSQWKNTQKVALQNIYSMRKALISCPSQVTLTIPNPSAKVKLWRYQIPWEGKKHSPHCFWPCKKIVFVDLFRSDFVIGVKTPRRPSPLWQTTAMLLPK